MINNTPKTEHAADYGPIRIWWRVSLAGTGIPGPAFSMHSPATPSETLGTRLFEGVVFEIRLVTPGDAVGLGSSPGSAALLCE